MIDNYLNYIYTKEYRLADGTLARNRPLKNTLWLDDMFMGVPALAQMGKLTGDKKYYDEAEMVVYDTDRNFDYLAQNYPMYFKIKNYWILLFSQKGDYRFTHSGSNKLENDTIGQIDFLNFPAKFADKRLIVLKNQKSGIYSTKQIGEKIDDDYLKMYYTQLLKEQKLDYQTSNSIELLSRKKDEYYFTGGFFDFPDWVFPSFINTAYFQVAYNNESLFFKEKAIKYFKDSK